MRRTEQGHSRNAATVFLGVVTKVFEALGAEKSVSIKRTHRPLPTKVTEDQFTEIFVSQISRLPIRAKQLLMLDLYADKNLFLERFIDFLVNPIIGRQGLIIDVDENAPETKNVFHRFTKLNKLDVPRKQRGYVRDYLLTGEVCLLKVPNVRRNTFQLIQIAAPVIRQTIVDPGNYTQVIGVEQEIGQNSTIMHKVICDEDVLTPEAMSLRQHMKFECYLFQNLKRSYPTASPYARDLLHKYELRGEPFLINSADLLQALVSYLWKTLDKMDAWNLFNYKFTVETSGTEAEDVQEELDEWAAYLGKPEPNSAIYLPKDLVTMEPVSFPMQSADLGQFYRMVRNATAWHGATRETAMGEGEVRYASNAAPGVSEPSVETKEILQRDQEDFFAEMYDDIGRDAVQRGEIPARELKEKDPPEFKYSIISNEISKVSQIEPTEAFAKLSDTAIKLQQQGMATPASLHRSVMQKAKELLGLDLEEPEQASEEDALQPQAALQNPIAGQENLQESEIPELEEEEGQEVPPNE